MKQHIRTLLAAAVIAGVLGVPASGGQANVPASEGRDWQELLQQARAAWRTNSAGALALSSRAITIAPSNAVPWMMRAAIHDSRREHQHALTNASEALRLDPQFAEAWQLRGTLHFKTARFPESVADFDRFLALVPSQRPHHWQRGISLYYAGRFEEGRKQFELHETVNPNDVENAVWHFLCVARSHDVEHARKLLLKPGKDPRVPMAAIYALFAGNGTVEDVLSTAKQGKTAGDAEFYAHLYLGLYYEALKEMHPARQHIDNAVVIGPNHYMGDVARVHAVVLRQRQGR